VHASKVYEIHVHTCYLILTKEIALIPSKMNAYGTTEMNVLNAGKVNTLSLLYVLSHTSYIFSMILL